MMFVVSWKRYTPRCRGFPTRGKRWNEGTSLSRKSMCTSSYPVRSYEEWWYWSVGWEFKGYRPLTHQEFEIDSFGKKSVFKWIIHSVDFSPELSSVLTLIHPLPLFSTSETGYRFRDSPARLLGLSLNSKKIYGVSGVEVKTITLNFPLCIWDWSQINLLVVILYSLLISHHLKTVTFIHVILRSFFTVRMADLIKIFRRTFFTQKWDIFLFTLRRFAFRFLFSRPHSRHRFRSSLHP